MRLDFACRVTAKIWYNIGMKKEYKATSYASDLTDRQWEAIKGFFPVSNKSKYHKRSLVEAVLYILKTGCQWRMLPHDYPPHDTVWSFYRRERKNRTWDKVLRYLVKMTRKKQEGMKTKLRTDRFTERKNKVSR